MLPSPALTDRFGRHATDLRISVTDRCNFRCTYCMPPEGLPWLPKERILTYEEIERLTGILVSQGVRSIKVTGGEPLVRRDVGALIARLRSIENSVGSASEGDKNSVGSASEGDKNSVGSASEGDKKALDISMTTNGYLLADAAAGLAHAGLDRVTVSVDSLLRHRFRDMTLRDALQDVMRGLEAAAAAGLTPIKINTVVIRGINDDEVVSFAELARRTDYDVRFIEYMPLDAQDEWVRDKVVPGSEILAAIAERFPLEADSDEEPEPATPFRFADGAPGRVGVIPSVTEPFCDTCNRLRLTADGHLRACLFSLDETDLLTPLRAGASDDELASLARECVAAKWAGHRVGMPDFVKPARSMSMIGG